MLRIGIVANEPSGDLLGAGLIRALKKRYPDTQFEGVGGPLMIAEGCHSLYPLDRLSVMGLVEVIKHLPELLSIRKAIKQHFLSQPPDLFIGIDAPDFNLGLEIDLRQSGIPTVHYVSPTVWAWRQKRVKKIKKAVDLMLCIFPFEEAFLQKHQVPATYVGHPLADEIPLDNDPEQARSQLGLGSNERLMALLPGSRMSEIQSLSRVFIQAALLCWKKYPELRFVVPFANSRTRRGFESVLSEMALPEDGLFRLMDGQAREAISSAEVVLTASGTATLEALLLRRPMVVAYRVSPVTYFFLKTFNLIKTKYVAMANLLSEEPLAKEFIQDDATAGNLSKALLNLLESPQRRAEIQAAYGETHQQLQRNSSVRGAEAILKLIGKTS